MILKSRGSLGVSVLCSTHGLAASSVKEELLESQAEPISSFVGSLGVFLPHGSGRCRDSDLVCLRALCEDIGLTHDPEEVVSELCTPCLVKCVSLNA